MGGKHTLAQRASFRREHPGIYARSPTHDSGVRSTASERAPGDRGAPRPGVGRCHEHVRRGMPLAAPPPCEHARKPGGLAGNPRPNANAADFSAVVATPASRPRRSRPGAPQPQSTATPLRQSQPTPHLLPRSGAQIPRATQRLRQRDPDGRAFPAGTSERHRHVPDTTSFRAHRRSYRGADACCDTPSPTVAQRSRRPIPPPRPRPRRCRASRSPRRARRPCTTARINRLLRPAGRARFGRKAFIHDATGGIALYSTSRCSRAAGGSGVTVTGRSTTDCRTNAPNRGRGHRLTR